MALLIKIILFFAGLILCVKVAAQDVDPALDGVRVAVNTFSLAGAQHLADGRAVHGLTLAAIERRALQERTRFGPLMSIDEINRLADALTLYVRSFGLPFHTVFLPPQRVEQGRVELRVQEGVLGAVHVINKTTWTDTRFEAPFERLKGTLLYAPDVEAQVQALKAQAGFKVFAFYSRGQKPGEAVLNLRVDAAKTYAYSLRADNYGSAASGQQRMIAQFSKFQLSGHHDRLDVGVLQTLGGVSNRYGSLGYSLPFGRLRYVWDINATNNQFELGERFAALGLEGATQTLGSGVTWVKSHQPAQRASGRLGVYDKRNRLDAGRVSVADETSQAVTAQWSHTWTQPAKGGFLNTQLEYSYGQAQVARQADADFNKVDFSAQLGRGWGEGRWRHTLQLSGRGQFSDVSLPSIEGMALSGAYGVRAYASGLFNAERAVLGSLEWRLPNVLTGKNWRLEPFMLAEYGTGRDLDAKSSTRSASLSDWGLGASASWGRVRMNLMAVTSLGGDVNGVKLDDEHRVLCELRWQ
jgi:hemolysin activation/secretion protein